MADDLSAAGRSRVPRIAAILGGLGLLPFLAGALFAIVGGPDGSATALRYYAAVILSFMGGVHWGLAIADTKGPRSFEGKLQLTLSVVPALVAWFALMRPLEASLLLMAFAFLILLVGDMLATLAGEAPAWYPRLRIPLTIGVILSLLIATWG